jgi:ribosomal protein S12 methylthiotransferase accessory factor YcaO
MTSGTWDIAPWVVRGAQDADGLYLLGPRLAVLHLGDERELCRLSPDEAGSLVEEGILIRAGSQPAAVPIEAGMREPATGFLVAPRHTAEATALAAALEEIGAPQRWTVVQSWPDLDARPGSPPLAIHIGAVEHGHPERLLRDIVPRFRVLWLGEGADGPHVGPIFHDLSDVARYTEATRNWAFVRELEKLGFGDEWPLSVLGWLWTRPQSVARAIHAVLGARRGACMLLDEGRLVLPWTSLLDSPVDYEQLVSSQRWSKGMLRELAVEPSDELPGVFLGHCLGPCDAEAALEAKFGKGTTPIEAEETTVGEAVERFTAWLAGREKGGAPTERRTVTRHALADFHPFGPEWERYVASGSPELPMVSAVDELTGEMVAIPECLVAEPYRAPSGAPPTGGTTSGLAAFTSRDGAILRGAMELLERHNYYPAFLHQRRGELLDPTLWLHGKQRDELLRVVETLRDGDLRLWLLRYPDELDLPVLHAFLWDGEMGAMARGAGSSLSPATAALKATVEALQLRIQHRFVRETNLAEGANAAYVAWATPAVTDQIRAYLDAQPAAQSDLPSFAGDAELLGHIKTKLRERGTALLVADLPCPVAGWSAVRVLIPGITCHGRASRSAGGERLLSPRFPYPVPI